MSESIRNCHDIRLQSKFSSKRSRINYAARVWVLSAAEAATLDAPNGRGQPDKLAGAVNAGKLRDSLLQSEPLGVLARREIQVTDCISATQTESCPIPSFPPQWFTQSLMPTDYAVTHIDQQVSEAMSGANAPSSAEMADVSRGGEVSSQCVTKTKTPP